MGSEMCIRDSRLLLLPLPIGAQFVVAELVDADRLGAARAAVHFRHDASLAEPQVLVRIVAVGVEDLRRLELVKKELGAAFQGGGK